MPEYLLVVFDLEAVLLFLADLRAAGFLVAGLRLPAVLRVALLRGAPPVVVIISN